MKKTVIAGALTGLVLALGACSTAGRMATNDRVDDGNAWRIANYTLPDGRTIPCLFYSPSNRTLAMSCDWENAK